MNKKYTFFIIDDDPVFTETLTDILTSDGQTVYSGIVSTNIVPEVMTKKADCIVLSITTPGSEGIKPLQHLKQGSDLRHTRLVITSAHPDELDRQSLFTSGADALITKPIDKRAIADDLKRIIEEKLTFTFWGVHGTLTVPGRKTIRYGGNTPCVSLQLPGDTLFIFDGGSGIKELSNLLMSDGRMITRATIFISHPHWDHINGLPFFVPLYPRGNTLEICGPPNNGMSMRELIAGQMDGVYFPINIQEFGAKVSFRDLGEEQFAIDAITIQTIFLNHPGQCLGYRLDYKDKSFCYVTDNELYPRSNRLYSGDYVRKLERFIAGTDVLITDCTYTDEEYQEKIGWGHSSVQQVVDLADRTEVKKLYLFHHDLDQTDDDIDNKLAIAQTMLGKRGSSTICIAPKERESFDV